VVTVLFAHAGAGTNALDGLYSCLVAFVLTGVVFAVLRIMPRPMLIRRKSQALLVVKVTAAALLFLGALAFGAVYTGLAVLT
jgi:hypothetical protein